jgi:DNA-binding transcriptional regulator YdaS (Cro superfamily)
MNALLPYLLARDRDQIKALADACGTKPVYLSQVARGHRNASHTLAQAIQRATDGEVTVHDLRPDIYGDAPVQVPARPGRAKAAA